MRDPPDRVGVVAIGAVDERLIDEAADAVRRYLGLEVVDRRHVDPATVPATASDDEADEYDAFSLARTGFECSNAPLCLTVTDRRIRHGGTSVFGIGEIAGRVAAVSTEPLGFGVRGSDPDERLVEHVRKQAVCHTGRLLGIEECDTETCAFSVSPTVFDLDDETEGPCEDCTRELAGLGLRPGRGDSESDGRDPQSETPEDQGRKSTDEGPDIPWSDPTPAASAGDRADDTEPGHVSAVTHDVANTARFVGMLVGFGVSFVIAVQVVSPAVEFLAGSWSDLSNQMFYLFLVVTVVVTYLVYRVLKRLFGVTRTRLVAAIRSRAQEYLGDAR